MPKAVWNNQVIAEAASADIHRVEGNVYFPPSAVRVEFLQPSDTHTTCMWKGVASYYDIIVDGQVNKDAAWYYPATGSMASSIRNYIAFWRGVRIEE